MTYNFFVHILYPMSSVFHHIINVYIHHYNFFLSTYFCHRSRIQNEETHSSCHWHFALYFNLTITPLLFLIPRLYFLFPTSIQLYKSCIHLEAPLTEITLPVFIEFILKAELLYACTQWALHSRPALLIFIVAVWMYSVFNLLVILLSIDCTDRPGRGCFCLF